MKSAYIRPESKTIIVQPGRIICLSLTGGTEELDSSDLPGIPFEDVFPF